MFVEVKPLKFLQRFCFVRFDMNFEDFRKQRSDKFLDEHTLSEDELERLIENKFNRARSLSEAFRKREKEVVDFD